MKKQILTLVILALFAGTLNVFGQATHQSDPRPLDCVTDAFHPIAGIPYDYSATIDPENGSAYWYATDQTTFMSNGARVPGIEDPVGGTYVAAATNYMDNTAPDASPTTTNITWTTDGLAAATVLTTEPPELFVAIEYTAPATACANNMKVYPIRPLNAFIVDIMDMDPDAETPSGYDIVEEQCVDIIQSAVWVADPAPDGSIDYDFGLDTLYFEVIAANFTESFTPSFILTGLQGDQTADVAWGYNIGTYDQGLATGVTGSPVNIAGTQVLTDETNTSTGVSIFVRVIIHNNNFESLAQSNILMAVDALNSANQPDVDNDDCTVITPYSDIASQMVNPRPTVNAVAPGVFLPVHP